MVSRQFGAGSRDPKSAARQHLRRARDKGALSYSSVGTLSDRLNPFVRYFQNLGVRRLESVTPELVIEYGKDLAEEVEAGDRESSTAQNQVSAVNTLMRHATKGAWTPISPTHDCAIPKRRRYRVDPPTGLDTSSLDYAVEQLIDLGFTRQAALSRLCRALGLRTKEAALLDIKAALEEALRTGMVIIWKGSKGGRRRVIPASRPDQLAALAFAAEHLGGGRCLVPADITWQRWRDTALKAVRLLLKSHGIETFHDLRAAYACQRYLEITGENAPVCGGHKIDRTIERAARLVIAEELGHGRIDVVSAYVGRAVRK